MVKTVSDKYVRIINGQIESMEKEAKFILNKKK